MRDTRLLIEGAANLRGGRRDALRTHARTFVRLGCDKQRRRTEVLVGNVGSTSLPSLARIRPPCRGVVLPSSSRQ